MTKKVHIDIVAKDKTKQAINSTKKSLGGLKKFALAAGAAMAAIGTVRVIKDLVNVGKEIESLNVRFKFLFGSADEGAKAFDNLATFAGRVPFSLQEISAASGNLAVVSKDANDLSRILEITGNVAAVTGLDFQTTASQIQRAFSGGIAAADVFREKGVRSLLGFKQGAKVSIEDTVKAFEENFSGEGRFGKATDELANTFEGTVSMIGDKFFQLKQAINESFFTEVTAQFGDLNKALDENREGFLAFGRAVGSILGTGLKEFVDTIKLIVSAFQLLGRTIDRVIESTGIFGTLIEKILTPFGLFGEVLGYVAENNDKWAESLDNILPKTEEFKTNMELMAQEIKKVTKATEEAIVANDNLLLSNKNIVQHDDRRMNQINKVMKADRDKVNAEKDGLKQTGQALKNFADEGAKRSKKMFRLQQAVNIGQAIMSTYTGAANALRDIPPPFNFAVAALTVATGLAQVANIRSQQPPAQFGGSRLPNSPFLVGEKGPELFTPNTAGSVTPNHQLGGGGATVNFNITTVDASSFGALLDTRRGQIVNMINSALNNKGQAALV
jgi:methyl-accepting chemotaxis protein